MLFCNLASFQNIYEYYKYFSTGRDPSQDFCQPTSAAHAISSRLQFSAGTKSLNSSPLMVAKSRRGLSSLQHGEPLYPGDRYSSGYSSNQPIPNVNSTGPSSFFPVENDSSMASLPRNRRLSGSQQQEVICLVRQIL